ncbi:MAG: glycosyltransferase family 4 protein [Phycisphaerae bacterium]|nr:glycosyltransferase family 4 protein [Phycisphaerae bacterium]
MNWYPFEGSATPIFAAVLRHLKQKGHSVTILTSIPYFLKGRQERWTAYRGKWYVRETWQDMAVHRVRVFSPRFLSKTPLLLRAVNAMSYSLHLFAASLVAGRFDAVMTISHPPLLAGITAVAISRIKRCPGVYCLEDIYPDILEDLQIVKTGPCLHFLKRIEGFIYAHFPAICVLSEQMRTNLLEKCVAGKRLSVIPHFSEQEAVVPPRDNPVSRRFGLLSHFVVLLPGSLTYRSGLDTVLAAAKHLRDDTRIRFVLIDRGDLRHQCKEAIQRENLANVTLVPFLPAEDFACLLAAADVCLVSLERGFDRYSAPSKLYRVMASRRAVLAVAEGEGQVAHTVKAAACGLVVEPHDAKALAKAIVKLADNADACRAMGERGAEYAAAHFSEASSCRAYERLLHELVETGKGS